MAVYRFRVLFEDYEDVYRDIEIKSNQTFEDFHKAIQKAIGFDNSQLASFYMSDDNWRKGLEITLMEMSDEDDDQDPKMVMSKSVMSDFIDDPHQKIVYIFDFLAMWTFYIELIKIIPAEEPKAEYPRCVKSGGDAPKQYKNNKLPIPGEDDEDIIPKTGKISIFAGLEEEFGLSDGLDDDDEIPEGFDDAEEDSAMEGAHEEHE